MTKIMPVVHMNSVEQAVEMSGMAFEAGADGVFLIDHNMNRPTFTFSAYAAVAESQPEGRFVGANLLDAQSGYDAYSLWLGALSSGEIPRLPHAIWQDDANPGKEMLIGLRNEHPELKRVLYFGGVAFKYTQTGYNDAVSAAGEAQRLNPFVDVVTTSGTETGAPPSRDKIEAMGMCSGDKPLAVASGISTKNLKTFHGLVDYVLVGSSIETGGKYSGVFDQTKLQSIIDVNRKLNEVAVE